MAKVLVIDGRIVVEFTQDELGMEVELRGPQVAANAAPRTFYTKAEIRAGGGFPCSVVPACDKRLSTLNRASRHALTYEELQEFGHYPGNEAD